MPTIVIPDQPNTMEIPEQCQQEAREILEEYGGILNHAESPLMQKMAEEIKLLAGVE